MADEQTKSVFGKDLTHENVADYEPHEDYAKQKESRRIKHLMFPWQVESPNPMYPDGPTILKERVAQRGEVVSVEELGPLALERGERLGSFFTDAELEAFERRGAAPAEDSAVDADVTDFSELGEHELAAYIENNKPNVSDTVAMAQDDPETAQRVLEAERLATKGVPRAGVEQGLAPIIARGQQT